MSAAVKAVIESGTSDSLSARYRDVTIISSIASSEDWAAASCTEKEPKKMITDSAARDAWTDL
jgi:hypothetical protein